MKESASDEGVNSLVALILVYKITNIYTYQQKTLPQAFLYMTCPSGHVTLYERYVTAMVHK